MLRSLEIMFQLISLLDDKETETRRDSVFHFTTPCIIHNYPNRSRHWIVTRVTNRLVPIPFWIKAEAVGLRWSRTWLTNHLLAGEGSRLRFDTKSQQFDAMCGLGGNTMVGRRASVKGVMAVIILMSPQNIKTKLKTIKTFCSISMGMDGRRQYKNNGNHFEWSKVQI